MHSHICNTLTHRKVWMKLRFQALVIYCDDNMIWSSYSELVSVDTRFKYSFFVKWPESEYIDGLKFKCSDTSTTEIDPGFTYVVGFDCPCHGYSPPSLLSGSIGIYVL